MKKLTLCVTIFLTISLSIFAQGKKSKEEAQDPSNPKNYKLTENIDLKGIGLKLKGLAGGKQIPVTAPSVFDGEQFQDGKKEKVRLVNELEFLINQQTVAVYAAPMGGIHVYKPKIRPKFAIPDQYQVHEEMLEALNKAKQPETLDEIVQWYKSLTGIAINLEDLAKPTPKGNYTIYTFKTPLKTHHNNKKMYSQRAWVIAPLKEDTAVFLLEYGINIPSDPKIDAQIQKDFEKIAATISFSSTTYASAIKGKSAPISKKKNRSKDYLTKLEATKNMVKNMQGWSCIETDNYVLATNSKDKKLVTDITQKIDDCRAIFTSYYPEADSFINVGLVKLFNTREEYVTYVPPDCKWSAGLFSTATGELLVSGHNDKSKETAERMLSTLYHEAFHHFLHQASNGQRGAASWMNEGSARVFENIKFRGRVGKVELTDDNYERWTKDIPSSADAIVNRINQVIQMSQPEFYSGNANANYNFSGAMMYFILKSPAVLPNNGYNAIAQVYFDELCKGNEKATEKAWEGVDKKKFAQDMLDFYSKKPALNKAATYSPKMPKKK